jgi:rare lipoprotein A
VIEESHLLVVALLQVTLLRPTSAGERKPDECGLASVYSTVSEETASGKDTRSGDLTAAHRSLAFGTIVHVDNRENGHFAVVRITDRGPFISGRIIDVSQAVAAELGFSSLTQVCLSILSTPEVEQ